MCSEQNSAGYDEGLTCSIGMICCTVLLQSRCFRGQHALFAGLSLWVVQMQMQVEGGQTSTGSLCNWYKRVLNTTPMPMSVSHHESGIHSSTSQQKVSDTADIGSEYISYAQLDAEAAAVPIGADGLLCLDHFQVSHHITRLLIMVVAARSIDLKLSICLERGSLCTMLSLLVRA